MLVFVVKPWLTVVLTVRPPTSPTPIISCFYRRDTRNHRKPPKAFLQKNGHFSLLYNNLIITNYYYFKTFINKNYQIGTVYIRTNLTNHNIFERFEIKNFESQKLTSILLPHLVKKSGHFKTKILFEILNFF